MALNILRFAVASTVARNEMPARAPEATDAHCRVAVVGAGWAGAYFAWRLAVDSGAVNASDVCVFEANGRAGGRVYSLRGLPGLGDLTLDVGAYRYLETDYLPAQLVAALQLPTACYDYQCAPKCEGGGVCRIIKDPYGNNAGYAVPIERMLEQLEAGGGTVRFGKRLTGVFDAASPSASPAAQRLVFADGTNVTAETVLLNLPHNALWSLHRDSIVLNASLSDVAALDNVTTMWSQKVYVHYDDAWWASKLGLMEGSFDDDSDVAPFKGRYHDGPLKCVIGHDPTGQPIYSDSKVAYGNCSGALEVYYAFSASPYYAALMASPLEPLTVARRGDAAASSKALLDDLHRHLIKYHTSALQAKGVDPASLQPPTLAVVANWGSDARDTVTPGFGVCGHDQIHWPPPALECEGTSRAARRPLPGRDLFIANIDYAVVRGDFGWAVGSLQMAEKVLQAEVGLPRPSWLDAHYYNEFIVNVP